MATSAELRRLLARSYLIAEEIRNNGVTEEDKEHLREVIAFCNSICNIVQEVLFR